MAMPMVNEAREAYAGATVIVLTPDHLSGLYENNPSIDKILRVSPGHLHGLMAVVKLKELIEGEAIDIGYVLPPSFGSAASFKLAGVPTRVGYIADGRRLLLTKPLPLPEPLNSEHRSGVYFNLLRRGSGKDLTYVHPKLFLNEEDAIRASNLLSDFGIGDGEEYLAVAPQAVAESRRWGIENYTALAAQVIEEHDLKIILIGSADDRAPANAIAGQLPDRSVANLAGRSSVRESAALLSRAAAFVGNDSGVAHLAASVGCPVVVLSGADDPKETSPITSRKRLVRADRLDCISCVKNRCPESGDGYMACMNQISVSEVASSLSDLLQESGHSV